MVLPMMWAAAAAAMLPAASDQAGPARLPAGKAAIYAQIDRSEWDPPIYLTLDVRSGRFSVAQPLATAYLRRPRPAMRNGTLLGERRRTVRQAFRAAWARGLEDEECRTKAGENRIVISNAGPTALSLAVGKRQVATPSELGCWTPEAKALQDLLSHEFW